MRYRLITLLIAVSIASVVIPSPALARTRWPVIGCWDFNTGYFNHYAWKYRPEDLCTITETTAGIDHVHWKHWGSKHAAGTGALIDDLGFSYPAKMTAYQLHVTHNFLGGGTYASWYGKLHIVAKREFRGEVYRGPFNAFLDVTPQE